MAIFLDKFPKNLTEYPNAFKRQGAFPLEMYSVFSNLNEAKDYAENNSVAYVGQPLAVSELSEVTTGEGEETVTEVVQTTRFYVIGNTAGQLIELGTLADIDGLNLRLEAVEKFFEATDNLDQTIDTLYELQKYIDEHGEDFGKLHKDVKDIYTPYAPADMESGTPEVPESGYLVDKENQLRAEIQAIYKKGIPEGPANPETGEPGTSMVPDSGLLPDEVKNRVLADEALGERIDEIYDADGGLADDGLIKIPSGKLVEETNARIREDQKTLDLLLGTNANKENGEFYQASDGILAGIRGMKKEDGTYEYNNIVDYIQGSIPIATENQLGRVLSSNPETDKKKDKVKVENDGTMTVIDLNINKLYQTYYLIIDGGTATQTTFQQEQQAPTLEEV